MHRPFSIRVAALLILLCCQSWVLAESAPQAAPSAGEICPILVGQTVPALEVLDLDSTRVLLNDSFAAAPTVLVIYRGGW
ncbi:MAG: hypothetical protein H6678_08805 [Candidatus Delongbacteria bacterium]|nr:hypothetical protein [Candidatus Cloacimonadota bacterium]MCB9473895.1 hypothetical protein [Candidatus Delongbacteria bacterium]